MVWKAGRDQESAFVFADDVQQNMVWKAGRDQDSAFVFAYNIQQPKKLDENAH